MARRVHRFLPSRLPPPTPAQMIWLRRLWFVALALAVLADIAGAAFVLRDFYRNDPQFARVGLSSQIENDGSVTVAKSNSLDLELPIAQGSYITAINGKPVPHDTAVWDLAARLKAKDGQVLALTVLSPDGTSATHRVTATASFAQEEVGAVLIHRDTRFAMRVAISLFTCAVLICCSVLLFVRRPEDPVALLFSFSFLMFAGSIDPPMFLWSALGIGVILQVFLCSAWFLLVVGLAVFPDGKFVPRAVRWAVPVAALSAIVLIDEDIPELAVAVLAFVLPMFLLVCHVIKYRRYQPGIERQQVKWAAFGFGAGLVLLAATFAVLPAIPDSVPETPIYYLIILFLFNGGFLAMALGLLVSVLRFRLWEADRVISRSAISAAVTLAVGIIWTLSIDTLKAAVEWLLGEENATVATIAGAILAAGIFAPTQTLAMRWAKKRLAGDESRIKKLIGRLQVWRTTETPEEIGVRTLSALSAAVHCNAAALLVDGPRGPQLLAARDVEQADELGEPGYDPVADPRFPLTLPLEDEDGPIGQLLIGPRSDLNRYNAAQIEGLSELTEPLAETLRAALKRAQQAENISAQMGSVEERLARLERGGPRLSPT